MTYLKKNLRLKLLINSPTTLSMLLLIGIFGEIIFNIFNALEHVNIIL